ncbi:MAG TPA: CoA ester lyase [Caldimonas sp.]|jgi:citrate lyase subunit beta/citryl-CoA lyase|nr:CoA ester lyase [Caldimonas sp.]HEX2540153.1 CoA ester lyase [Caldimonas sp.]
MLIVRSLFFAPANRADLVGKFTRFAADGYVIDLEDGTPPAQKASARDGLSALVQGVRAQGLRGLLTVRVNEPGSDHYLNDLAAALDSDVDGIVVPKLESGDALFPALHRMRRLDRDRPRARPRFIVGGLESIGGVANAAALCRADPSLAAVYFGAEDLASELGARRTPSSVEVMYSRSQVLLHAKAARIVAIDQAVVEIRDDQHFEKDAEVGRDMGYDGKICLLPRQLDVANRVFRPSDAELEHARRLIAFYDEATARGIGTVDFEGKMIDGPLLKRAQRLVAFGEHLARLAGGATA